MLLTFVTGRAGSGKSRYLHSVIKKLVDAGEDAVLIVPEQFTFETERELSLQLPGLMDAAVYSFTTLASRVLRESGENTVFLSRQGRRMMIRRASEEHKKSFLAFAPAADRPGFAEKCDELFSLFKRFDISSAQLSEASGGAREKDALLADKLSDLSLIYSAVEGYMGGAMLDSDDALNILREKLPHSSVAGKHIIIDGFDMLTEQIYQVIGALMEIAASVHVSIRTGGDCRDSSVFLPEEKARERIRRMAVQAQMEIRFVRLPDRALPPARFVSEELSHLEHEAFAYPYEIYPGKCERIKLFAGTDRMAEVRDMASKVQLLARSGVRYREMAVIATDMAGYLSPVTREFNLRGIPYFTDAKHSLSMYAAPRLALLAVSAAAGAFRREDVVSLIKTGLAGVLPKDSDIFENHVIEHGLSGVRLTREFTGKTVPPEAESVRARVMEPLMRLRQALAAAPDAARKTEALYAYLEELHVYDQLNELTQELRDTGRRQLMEENAQVYDRLMELLSQLHRILGAGKMPVSKYLSVLKEGMEAYEVGAIPTTADQLLFGSVGRTRARSIKALFILGASEGLFPRYCPDEGVIDDRELSEFTALGLTPWDSTSERSCVELVNVYSALTKPSEHLYISWPLREGRDPAMPCAAVDRIRAIFPDISTGTDMGCIPDAVDAEGGVYVLGRRLSLMVDERINTQGTDELYAAISRSGPAADRLSLMESALYYNTSPEPFGQDLATELYGNMLYGNATRLEKFNSCPFAHFMRYGLKAVPRKEFTERSADEGTFLHEILSRCVREALSSGELPSPEMADTLVDGIAAQLITTHNNGIFLETARLRARSAELVRTVKTTLRAVLLQARSGCFTPVGTEVPFGEGRALDAITVEVGNVTYRISGVIDRLDGAQIDGEQYYRVVDYKRRERSLDYAELYAGLSLQLPLYIAAVEAAGAAVKAAGLYYMPISVLPVEAEDGVFERKLMEEFRLKGLTLSDAAVTEASKAGGLSLPGTGGMCASARDIKNAADYATVRCAKTLEALMQGRAEVSPFYKLQGKLTPCKYCDYSSACGFDARIPGCAYRVIGRMDADEYFSRIEKDDTADTGDTGATETEG